MTAQPAVQLTVTLEPEQIELIARRAAELLPPPTADAAWMDTQSAETYAGLKPGRLDDLKRLGKVQPSGYDGRKPMYRREDLDAYLRGAASGVTP